MRVLLRDDVSGVGKKGDIVEVAKGFARNYLLPTGRALMAGEKIETQAVAMRRGRDLRNVADRDAARSVAGILGATTVTVSVGTANCSAQICANAVRMPCPMGMAPV